MLLAAWEAKDKSDKSTAERLFFKAQSRMHGEGGDRMLQPPSEHAPIHQALRWVQQHFSKLKKCKNDECRHHPFFVAKGKEGVCSKECAHPGQKESKRRSWRKLGKEWRENQAKEKGDHKPSTAKQKKP